MTGTAGVVTALLLLGANAFFVAAEFALLAARRSRIEQLAEDGDRRAVLARGSLKELSLTLAGAQLGITMASLGLGAVGEPLVAGFFEQQLEKTALPHDVAIALGFGIGLAVVVFLHMVVGEMAPKSIAIADAENSSLRLIRPFHLFISVFRPVIVLMNSAANGVVRLFGVEPQEELATAHAPADLVMVLRESAASGTIGGAEHMLLTRALELSGLDAESVMIPRRDIVSVQSTASVDDVLEEARRTGRSRLPVHSGDLDQVLGIVHVKDLLLTDPDVAAGVTAQDLARPALVVPESRGIEDLMLDLRSEGQQVAMVVDEYGSVSGLVALEDVLEELIGEFDDETDRISRRLRRRPDGQVVLPGLLRPHELAEQIGLQLPDGPYETLAGYVVHQLGELPAVGATTTLGEVALTVAAVDGYRATEITIRPRGTA